MNVSSIKSVKQKESYLEKEEKWTEKSARKLKHAEWRLSWVNKVFGVGGERAVVPGCTSSSQSSDTGFTPFSLRAASVSVN